MLDATTWATGLNIRSEFDSFSTHASPTNSEPAPELVSSPSNVSQVPSCESGSAPDTWQSSDSPCFNLEFPRAYSSIGDIFVAENVYPPTEGMLDATTWATGLNTLEFPSFPMPASSADPEPAPELVFSPSYATSVTSFKSSKTVLRDKLHVSEHGTSAYPAIADKNTNVFRLFFVLFFPPVRQQNQIFRKVEKMNKTSRDKSPPTSGYRACVGQVARWESGYLYLTRWRAAAPTQ